ncbi:hypothetical protein GEOBRER4_n3709 [Citrifermentans bremense]|uniref:Uncharacterized protein n=1 Tax=Citrifermentans bremense TaxID=60035 RepID=A0A7R7FTJ8_9BACT|nr:hypothetical protein GEOBRER4_n3709 [Citrifermentans bremense]
MPIKKVDNSQNLLYKRIQFSKPIASLVIVEILKNSRGSL